MDDDMVGSSAQRLNGETATIKMSATANDMVEFYNVQRLDRLFPFICRSNPQVPEVIRAHREHHITLPIE
jgi:hypothetical protein